jgi:putative NADPH-quinone reductase
MAKRILLILGHPDEGSTYCRALADAYAGGALAAGHEVRRIDLATFEFPWLRSKAAFTGAVPPSITLAQQDVRWSDHLVFVFPLWLGTMPALLKAFLEQLLRPGFAHEIATGFPRGLLKGRSARVFVTMGMPAAIYRWFYGAHGLKALRRNILAFCGIGPIRECLIGTVESPRPEARRRWLETADALGRAGK